MTARAASGTSLSDSSVPAAIAVPGPAVRMSTPVAAAGRKDTNANICASPTHVIVLVNRKQQT
jgi:hypothetical protein